MPRHLRTRAQLTSNDQPSPQASMSSRPRRAAASATIQQKPPSPDPRTTITLHRNPSSSPSDTKSSIRLTVKMPPSKLREATSGNASSRGKATPPNNRSGFESTEIVNGPRSSRAKRSMVIDSGSEDDEDDEEDAEGDEEEEDAEGDEDEEMQDEEEEDEDEEDAEGEEDDDEEEEDAEGESDVDMADAEPLPPPPIIRRTGPPSKPTITVTTAPTVGKVKSVEAKEMQLARGQRSEEDDLSELSGEEDAEGEIVEDDPIEGEDDDAEGDSDDDTEDLSRDGTPDLSKMTKRQRGRMGDANDGHFMALNMGMYNHLSTIKFGVLYELSNSLFFLFTFSFHYTYILFARRAYSLSYNPCTDPSLEPQTKLILSDEQKALRRLEMARRRKNLSEKRNEEEKQDTINRLLKKQAPKRRGKISAAEIAAAGAETPDAMMGGMGSLGDIHEEDHPRADPLWTRWVCGPEGHRLGVPSDWKGKYVGALFGKSGWREMRAVEEVEG